MKNKKENELKEQENKEESKKVYTEEEFLYESKKWKYKTIAWVCLFVIFAVVITYMLTDYILIGKKYTDLYNSTSGISSDDESSESVQTSSTISDISKILSTFAEVIDENYVGDVDREELINSTIKGFVAGIGDEYSEYMTAEEWEEYQSSALGNYCGVGIYMTSDDDGNIVVVSTISGTPADDAGIQAEDIITAIDGVSTADMTTTDASNAVKGEEGTDVTLTIYRNGEYIDYTLTRSSIKVYHVESEMLDDNIGYISLLTFDEGCYEEFEENMDELVSQGATKIIFDLRYNTGGLVDEALDIIDLFVEKGATTLIEIDSQGNETVTTSDTDKKYDVEMVILINGYTASSSEIVTGALVDNGVATTVGTTTYGKGVIQNVYSLTDGSVLKLTTAEYYTPNKNKINGVGITPDYEVELETSDDGTVTDTQLEKAEEILQ